MPFYDRAQYIMLQASLLMRVMGDLALLPLVRRWGGLLNGVAILWFFGLMALTAVQAHKQKA